MTRHHNPGVPVAVIYCRDGNEVDPLPDGIEVKQTWKAGDNWHCMDALIYQWFRSENRIDAKRYVVLEPDVFCTESVESFYADVWHKDAAGVNVMLRGRDKWSWFGYAPLMPREWVDYAAGFSPFCGVFLSYEALSELAAMPLVDGIYCEMRIATALHLLGFNLYQIKRGWSLTWLPKPQSRPVPNVPGIYHPVRTLDLTTLSTPPASASVCVLPFYGEFGWMIARHVRYVAELENKSLVVCCRRGEECLYPNASSYFYGWAEGLPDSRRCENGSGNDSTVRQALRDAYPNHLIIRPFYPNPWAWDHATTKVMPIASQSLPQVDVALCPRRREHGIEKNWKHWGEVATAIRAAGYSVGLIGIESASDVTVDADAKAWNHPNGATAGTVDLLTHSRVTLCGDTGPAHLAAMMSRPMILFAPPHHYHGWSFVGHMRRATSGPFHQLPESAWDNPNEVIEATLSFLRGDTVPDASIVKGIETTQEKVESVPPLPSQQWGNGQGPALWERLHTARGVDQKWMDDFSASIPCGPCRSHWVQMISRNAPPLGDDELFFDWSVNRHNDVSERIGKESLSLSRAKSRWGR